MNHEWSKAFDTSRTGKPWTEEEDAEVLRRASRFGEDGRQLPYDWLEDSDRNDLAIRFKRTPAALNARFRKLERATSIDHQKVREEFHKLNDASKDDFAKWFLKHHADRIDQARNTKPEPMTIEGVAAYQIPETIHDITDASKPTPVPIEMHQQDENR